jgi:hypothetical protein
MLSWWFACRDCQLRAADCTRLNALYQLNRVATEVDEIAEAQRTLKITHVALDAV